MDVYVCMDEWIDGVCVGGWILGLNLNEREIP